MGELVTGFDRMSAGKEASGARVPAGDVPGGVDDGDVQVAPSIDDAIPTPPNPGPPGRPANTTWRNGNSPSWIGRCSATSAICSA